MIPEHILERGTMLKRKVPSLVDLCVRKAIINLRRIGDVGETDDHLLERFLPHCTADQLMHIENSTEERDLSQVTDKLWKKLFVKEFGSKSSQVVVERMKQKKFSFKWKELFKAQRHPFDRIKQLYEKEDARKQSRQIRLCTKVPPSRSKRSFFGGGGHGSSICNTKSGLMKKIKLEFLNSLEVKNLSAMKNRTAQSNYRSSAIRKPGIFLRKGSASTSKVATSMERRF